MAKHLVVAGAILEKEGKILLVQEKKPHAYGLWNTPAGWVDPGEDVITAAKREVKEESGFDIRLESIVGIYTHTRDGMVVLRVIFKAKIISGELNFPEDELLDAKWFTPKEILGMPDSKLRRIRQVIEDYAAGKNYPLDILKPVK